MTARFALALVIPRAYGEMIFSSRPSKRVWFVLTSCGSNSELWSRGTSIGGPFINYDAKRVPAIKALIDKTTTENAHLLAFADAIP